MSKLIILQGPPACGKTTWAKAWQECEPETRVIISRDAIRHARGKYWIPAQEKFITAVEEFMVEEALHRGYEVALDATNLNPTHLARWYNIAEKHGAEIENIMFHETLDTCIRRDKNNDRTHQVGEDVVRRFYGTYQAYCNINNIAMVAGTMSRYNLK